MKIGETQSQYQNRPFGKVFFKFCTDNSHIYNVLHQRSLTILDIGRNIKVSVFTL